MGWIFSLNSIVMKYFFIILISIYLCTPNAAKAHPMPSSMVVLKVHEKSISGEIMLPLSELQSAIGMSVYEKSKRLVERLGDTLKVYLAQHIRPKSLEGKPWLVNIGKMKVVETTDKFVGTYKELVVLFEMKPAQNYDLRNFYFDYDVILHGVASHKALLLIRQDWQQGFVREDTIMMQLGVIEWDVVNSKLNPFQVSLSQGSAWQGFKNMVSLGISHIKEGTDHILFILTLLLPAMLVTEDKRWSKLAETKESLRNLLKIVTAFTIGHSLTLILGTIQWLYYPVQAIEILIAITILISAFHAFRPIYPQKEILVAIGFGLIHGLAFSETLKNLGLSTKQTVLSILGFNIGIELAQLFIVLLVYPMLVYISKKQLYTPFRQITAIFMMGMAMFWLCERLLQ
jgi:HupE / UreJ protein